MLQYLRLFGKQAELYEELKIHSRMQKEFIDVAAHERLDPIQPILGLTEILRSKMREDDEKQNKLLDAVIRNAKRLKPNPPDADWKLQKSRVNH